MRVVIDAEKCQGHGRCFTMVPSLFTYDELGNGLVVGDGTLDAESLSLAQLAQSNCPEHAIDIEE